MDTLEKDIKLLITELDKATDLMYPQYSDEDLEKQKNSRLNLMKLVTVFKKSWKNYNHLS